MVVPATQAPVTATPKGLNGTLTPAALPLASRRITLTSGLRALVLLGGSVRESSLSKAIGRSMLDLPVGGGRTLMTLWQEQAATLASVAGAAGGVPLSVHLTRISAAPTIAGDPSLPRPVIEFDRAEYRGTGGVLRDACGDFDPDDRVLVANACQLILQPLDDLLETLAAVGADIVLLVDQEGTPSGLQLIRCQALGQIPTRGFVDFKEQALPLLARRFDVRVVRRPIVAVSVRTLESYIGALRLLHDPRGRGLVERDPFAEDCFSTFSVVEDGGDVGQGARIHDSVVLRGGRVGAGAVVARSVVCEGAEVEPGEVVVDRVVCGPRIMNRKTP